ncbi:hypothetical protein GCM10023324_40880 [Streptomyces youssoufiensis]
MAVTASPVPAASSVRLSILPSLSMWVSSTQRAYGGCRFRGGGRGHARWGMAMTFSAKYAGSAERVELGPGGREGARAAGRRARGGLDALSATGVWGSGGGGHGVCRPCRVVFVGVGTSPGAGSARGS